MHEETSGDAGQCVSDWAGHAAEYNARRVLEEEAS